MSFALDWLDLREPADHRARDPGLLAAAVAWLEAVEAPLAVDLGAGSGSTQRAFGGRIPMLRWRLVDRDAGLLSAAAARKSGIEAVEADLGDAVGLPLDGARLVTASALMDLASEAWIERLADRITAERIALYAALSYDGSTEWAPAMAEDGAVLRAFNMHQRGEKGLGGPALGPEGGSSLAAALEKRGYVVRRAPSPWRLETKDGPLQAALAAGIAEAAGSAGFAGAAVWGEARMSLAQAGRSSCRVGHIDVLALPR